MKIKPYFHFLFILFISHTTQALNVGDKLPFVNFTEGGAIFINDKQKTEYENWSNSELMGKKKIIQYLPGRMTVGKQNLIVNDIAYDLDYPERCRTTTIVNYSDALWGTRIFIDIPMKKNKYRTPKCEIVLDKKGIGLELWGLTIKKNVTIVVNENHIIEFFYEGKLNKKQLKHIMELTNPDDMPEDAIINLDPPAVSNE